MFTNANVVEFGGKKVAKIEVLQSDGEYKTWYEKVAKEQVTFTLNSDKFYCDLTKMEAAGDCFDTVIINAQVTGDIGFIPISGDDDPFELNGSYYLEDIDNGLEIYLPSNGGVGIYKYNVTFTPEDTKYICTDIKTITIEVYESELITVNVTLNNSNIDYYADQASGITLTGTINHDNVTCDDGLRITAVGEDVLGIAGLYDGGLPVFGDGDPSFSLSLDVNLSDSPADGTYEYEIKFEPYDTPYEFLLKL